MRYAQFPFSPGVNIGLLLASVGLHLVYCLLALWLLHNKEAELWLVLCSVIDKGGFMDLDHEDVMIIVPPIFAPKDVPENLVTFTSLMTIYGAIIEVLEEVGKDTSFEKYDETRLLLDVLQSFDFIFTLYLMVEILVFTNDLSVALQKRDQDLLNALSLVKATKEELQEMRNDGWEELISKVMEICNKHDIDVHDLNALYVQGKKPRRHATTSSVSNLHHYKHDYLFSLHELNARFDEDNTELLQCVSCLSPSSSFEAFDVKKLLRMVELYPNDFVDVPEVVNYVKNVRCDPKFTKLKGLSDLCVKLVETKNCNTFDIVYRLLKLALVLSVATPSMKRVFFSYEVCEELAM
ncbi:hypothetical protein GmHk_18G052102 [Glycine max]|nr:hypothetical protein GmHk_18G052102 [Glycine max]